MDQKDLKQISVLLDNKFVDYNEKIDNKFVDYNEKIDSKFNLQEVRLNKLETSLISVIDDRIDSRINKLEQKMFDWKSEIIDAVDSMAKEIRDEREFREISSHQISSNSIRIEKLEKKVSGVVESGV